MSRILPHQNDPKIPTSHKPENKNSKVSDVVKNTPPATLSQKSGFLNNSLETYNSLEGVEKPNTDLTKVSKTTKNFFKKNIHSIDDNK